MAKNSDENGKRSLDRDLCVSIIDSQLGEGRPGGKTKRVQTLNFEFANATSLIFSSLHGFMSTVKMKVSSRKKTMTVSIIEGIIHGP